LASPICACRATSNMAWARNQLSAPTAGASW
jgi:hypothetical protein